MMEQLLRTCNKRISVTPCHEVLLLDGVANITSNICGNKPVRIFCLLLDKYFSATGRFRIVFGSLCICAVKFC